MSTHAMLYKRVLLKLSGETLLGEGSYGVCPKAVERIALLLQKITEQNVELAVVIGGGNIFRGVQGAASGMKKVAADQMGMLATVFNGLALVEKLRSYGVKVALMAPFSISSFVQTFSQEKASETLKSGGIVFFVGGTGNPLFTTDTAAALRAVQIEADVLLKGTKVDGVYDKDPEKFPEAVRFPEISYQEVLQKRLAVMDQTAVILCRENALPIRVFDAVSEGGVMQALRDQDKGTIIKEES